MKRARTQLHFLPSDHSVLRAFRSGISLHGHTEHSRESMGDLPHFLERMPVVGRFMQWEMERYRNATGISVDFSRAFWTGPVSARAAHELERKQIERLGLAAIVSLTDHDNIDAPVLLRSGMTDEVPISVEWTAPFENSVFHLGVHNLPAGEAAELMRRMAAYTEQPRPEALGELLGLFRDDASMLTIFNHPLWDIGHIGGVATQAAGRRFLAAYGDRIHGLELNGLRSWDENMRVMRFAEETGQAAVSGGDRHGFEPNANINLTRATSFAEFVREIREERSSDIAMLPQYNEPLLLRHLLTAWDAAREHPELAGKRSWAARVFVIEEDGTTQPMTQVWAEGVPRWIDPCLNVIGLVASAPVRAAGRLAGFGVRGAV